MAQTPTTTVTNQYAQANNVQAESNSILLISQRGTRDDAPISPLNNYALYTRHNIPSQYTSSPDALLAYFSDTIGATVQTGVEDTINLSAPTSVTPVTISGQDYIDLIWSTEPVGWENISGVTIVGTATQGGASGTIFRVSTSGYTIRLSNVTGTFTTLGVIVLNYINKSISLPDGDATEKFVLSAYYASTASSSLVSTVNVSTTAPTIDIIFVSDRDSLFNANPTPVDLGAVDTVIDNGDGTITLEWENEPTNWLYVPENGLGQSYVEGSTTSDTGVIEQTLGAQYSPSNNPYNILISPADGASFSDGDTITMYLDDAISLFDQIEQESYKFVSVFADFTDTTQITEATGDLWQFTEYLQQRNANMPVANGELNTYGVVGTTTLTVEEYDALEAANFAFYITPFYYYNQKFNDPTFGDGEISAQVGTLLSSNEVPFNNMIDYILNGVPVSSDSSSYISVSTTGDSETIINKGGLPIAVNNQKEAYIVLPVTTQVFIPGSQTPDTEFNDVHSQQAIGEIKNRTWAIGQLPSFKGADVTASLLASVVNAVSGMQTQAELEGLLTNVTAYQNDIVAAVDPTNNRKVLVSQVIQPTGSLSSFAFTNIILFGTDTTQTQA